MTREESRDAFWLTIENNNASKTRDYRVINESRVCDLGSVVNEGCDIMCAECEHCSIV